MTNRQIEKLTLAVSGKNHSPFLSLLMVFLYCMEDLMVGIMGNEDFWLRLGLAPDLDVVSNCTHFTGIVGWLGCIWGGPAIAADFLALAIGISKLSIEEEKMLRHTIEVLEAWYRSARKNRGANMEEAKSSISLIKKLRGWS
jgi:hypothetical protein